MKKKILIAAVVLFFVASTSVFSLGIGASFGLKPFGDLPGEQRVMFSLKTDDLPFLLGFGFEIGEEKFNLGTTFDYLLVRQNLFNFVNFYAGPGGYLGIMTKGDDELAVQFGLRVPLALYIFPLDVLELFIEIAPTWMIFDGEVLGTNLGAMGALGFRFWF
jgi:hypothetical protein